MNFFIWIQLTYYQKHQPIRFGGLVYGVSCHFHQYFSYIVAVSFIGVGNQSTRRNPPTCRKSLTNFITYCCIDYTLPWTGFELITLVVIGTDYTGNCKSNYHMITTMTATQPIREFYVWKRAYNVSSKFCQHVFIGWSWVHVDMTSNQVQSDVKESVAYYNSWLYFYNQINIP